AELWESVDSPDDLGRDHWLEAAFAAQAIGRPVLGSGRRVCAAARQDGCDWLNQEFVPSRLVLAASGKVDAGEVLKVAEHLFGDMEQVDAPPVEPAQFTGGVRDDRRSFEQAHWCLAFRGLAADDLASPALAL